MKRVPVSQLTPGMVAAEDVYSFNDQLLISKNTVLTDAAITILGMYDIFSIRIDDQVQNAPAEVPLDTDVANTEAGLLPDDASNMERVRNSVEFRRFKAGYDEELGRFHDSFVKIIDSTGPVNTEELLSGTLSLVSDISTASGILEMLNCMRDYDDSTYAHSINVALICNVAARWLGFSEEDVHIATACGLFHDIGKLMISKDILDKPDKLSEAEYTVIKTHPVNGYKLLRERGVDEQICNAALMHHERCDGSGYPLGLTADKIDRMAKLVSIADVYDAMTAKRIYRGPMCPFRVIEMFEKEGLQKYEPSFIIPFLENVVNTYLLNRCLLSNGDEGNIIYINKDNLSRPVVQVKATYVDLSEKKDLQIESLI